MSTIVTRAGKGSALTWTEGDANITNLNNDKMEDIVEDTTPQLGGNLDVNGNSIVSTSNGNINIEPNGTGKVVTTKTLNANILASTQSAGDEGGQVELALAATNTTLTGSVAIDINQNRLRIFETGGSNRGAYIDLSAASTSVGTNLVSGGGISNVVEDLTPQLGGNLDLNSYKIITASGNLNIEPASAANANITTLSTGNINLSAATGNVNISSVSGKVYIDSLEWPTADGTSNQVLKTDGSGVLSWTTLPSAGIANVVEDTTPQLGGDLDLNSYKIITASGNVNIEPASGSNANITTLGAGNINLSAATGNVILGSTSGIVRSTSNLQINTQKELRFGDSDNTNYVGFKAPATVSADVIWTLPSADGTANYVLKTNGSGTLSWVAQTTAFDPASPGAIGGGTAAAGTFTALTASTSASLKGITEGALYDLGTTGGTLAPNVANGNVQKVTLNSALTINAFTSPVAGQTLTLIIYGGTSYTSITSTMKFAGGIKTLTATAGCIDILSVYYDGTNYFASLGKGFA